MHLHHLARPVAGTLVALVVLGCHRAGSGLAGPFAYEYAPPPEGCGPLPLLVDTAGWAALPVFGQQLTLRLPAGFVADTTVRFWHGGRLWRRGPVSVEEARGHWDYSSFRPFRSRPLPRRYSECETRVGRFTVLFVEREDGRLRVTAWVRDTVHVERPYGDHREHRYRPDIMLAAEGPRGDSALLRTIMRSLR